METLFPSRNCFSMFLEKNKIVKRTFKSFCRNYFLQPRFFLQTAQLVMVFLWPQALSAYYVTSAIKEEKEMVFGGGGAERKNLFVP